MLIYAIQVMRLALSMIVLCEILEVDLDDSRLVQARNSTMEMVADSEASETAGLSWALTVSQEKGYLLFLFSAHYG